MERIALKLDPDHPYQAQTITITPNGRTKEFLIAYPSFFLLFWVTVRGQKKLLPPLTVIATIGFASVINTFCHGFSPYGLSMIRSSNALLLGTIPATLLVAVAEVIWRLCRRRKSPIN